MNWPNQTSFLASFVGMFDWDQLNLKPQHVNVLSFPIHLCTSALPCSLVLLGQANVSLQVVETGNLVCSSADGCLSIEIQSIDIYCAGNQRNSSVISISGAEMTMRQIKIRDCWVNGDGAGVQAYKGAYITAIESTFENMQSSGFGGVFSMVGSTLSISVSSFSNCSASMGGAISAADYQCSQTTPILSYLGIESSIFDQCTSAQRGGALYAGSGRTEIHNSTFKHCQAKLSGGSIYSERGSEVVQLFITDTVFRDNEAGESGGGAIHAKNVSSIVAGSVATGNKALSGGGGVILWEDSPSLFVCGPGSYSASTAFECTFCQAGKYQSGVGMTSNSSCFSCGAGSYSISGAEECVLCGIGKYSGNADGSSPSTCEDCSEGLYQTGTGMISPMDCELCPSGTYSIQTGASSCTLCEAGTFSTAMGSVSALSCTEICSSGSFSIAGASTCTPCGAGTYSTGDSIMLLKNKSQNRKSKIESDLSKFLKS